MNDQLRKEYLEKHLPYRINSLLAPDLITHRRNQAGGDQIKTAFYSDSLTLEPAFEISILFGRSLLNFLGIGYDAKNNLLIEHKPKADDFTIKTLFPDRNFCSLNDDIVIQYEEGLKVVIKVANKSVAHLTATFSDENEHNLIHETRLIIYKLVLKCIPEIKKESIWWHSQVETTG